jgi:hypothetical protein
MKTLLVLAFLTLRDVLGSPETLTARNLEATRLPAGCRNEGTDGWGEEQR